MKQSIMEPKDNTTEKDSAMMESALSELGHVSEGDASPVENPARRFFFQQVGLVSCGFAAEAIMSKVFGVAHASDLVPTYSTVRGTPEIKDYSNIPQRTHKYPASNRAKEIVHSSMTMETLFSGIWPDQWSSPEAPEFHDEMDRLIVAGIKVIAACPSADSLDSSVAGIMRSLMFYLNKIYERPDKYKIVRTTKDIDEAIEEKKLGIFFTHQGTALFNGDIDMVGVWRQMGYGYCLLAYNQRNAVGDGCFEEANGPLTAYGKKLIDSYNRYGMIVDVSHTGERTSLDAIERSRQPVVSSHSVAKAIADYQRSHSDAVIKAIAQSGGVCSINAVGAFVDLSNPDIVTTDILFRHIDYIVNLVGIDHVGFGTDYVPNTNISATLIQTPEGQEIFPDGGYSAAMGAKGVPTPAPYQIVAALVDKMLENGYSEVDCGKFLGGNMYRVMQEVWT
ncbi:dipeptidase [Okeania sp. SIO2C2]|uniref:dipeptidase n=1 Tax=Okeania sp. SIO2C2 TaxID=2607787 RepID=UPI00257BFB8B|nr:membrane dipeptidase [Okeania sp. SIO2C2]